MSYEITFPTIGSFAVATSNTDNERAALKRAFLNAMLMNNFVENPSEEDPWTVVNEETKNCWTITNVSQIGDILTQLKNSVRTVFTLTPKGTP